MSRASTVANPRYEAYPATSVHVVMKTVDASAGSAFIAFNPNGVIRTFFRPNDGERYWRRQAERGE